MALTTVAAEVYRDYSLDGVPSSGMHEPKKPDIRRLLGGYEQVINAFTSAGGLIYDTRALLISDLEKSSNSLAWVIADSISANNGVYKKVGPSGTGSWVRVADLPYSFIVAEDTGAGTANAIEAVSSLPISSSVLVLLNIFETSGPGPVTVRFNGTGPIYTIKTASGNDPADGGLPAGLLVIGRVAGDTFRLSSDQASSAIQAAAEAAAAIAADYAALARNDVVVNPFVGDGSTVDWPLSVDPGSANNIRVNIGGAFQLRASYSLVYVDTVPTLRLAEPAPDGVPFDVEMGFRIAVGTPATGSVAYDKIQNVSAALRLLGRKAGGSGVVQEITPEELRDLFLPTGSIVQSVSAVPYTASAALSANIPLDDTIPQITEGTQILTVSITPKSASNKLRIRFAGVAVTTNEFASDFTWAIFHGAASAIRAGTVVCRAAGNPVSVAGEVEYVPGALTAQTITVRVGANAANVSPVRMNGSAAARLLGGAQGATLIVEEVKA